MLGKVKKGLKKGAKAAARVMNRKSAKMVAKKVGGVAVRAAKAGVKVVATRAIPKVKKIVRTYGPKAKVFAKLALKKVKLKYGGAKDMGCGRCGKPKAKSKKK
jgi:hypothetical protein